MASIKNNNNIPLCEIVKPYLVDGEEARDIEGYEELYCVTNYGRVFSGYYHKFLTAGHAQEDDRLTVNLWKVNSFKIHSIHVLVAKAFISNPDNLPVVNHKDENPQNNRSDNLEWCTQEYNVNYGTAVQRRSIPIYCPELDAEFSSITAASNATGVPAFIIRAIVFQEYNDYHFELLETPEKIYLTQDNQNDNEDWYIHNGILHYKDKEKDEEYQRQFLSEFKLNVPNWEEYKKQGMTQKEINRKLVADKQKEKDDIMFELVKKLEIKDYKYKELCALFGCDSAKGGNSKTCQINNWKRFFRWEHPTSHIYRVVEIYDEPLEKIDMRRKIYRDKD